MSAQSWYKDFTRRLNATNYRASQAPSGMPFSIDDVARVQLGADFDPYLKLAGRRNPIGVGEHLMDWGGRALDVISRPGYAVGGVLNAALENKGGQVDLPKELWEGLSGQDKRFFQPAQLIDPTEEGDSFAEKGGKWVVDFLASIATDPLTFVPIAKGAQVAGRLAGLDKATNALRAGNRPVDELDALRTATANERPVIGEIADKPAELPKELSDRPFILPENRQIEAAPKIGVVDERPEGFIGPQGPTMPPIGEVVAKPDNFDEYVKQATNFTGNLRKPAGLSERDQLNVLQLVRDSISQSLRGIKGTFNASEIKSPFRTVANDAEIPREPVRPDIPEPVAPEIKPANPRMKVNQNVIVRTIIESASGNGSEKAMIALSKKHPGRNFYADDTDMIVKDGVAVSPYDIAAKYGPRISEFEAKNPKARAILVNEAGERLEVTPTQYKQMLTGEFPLKELEGMQIIKNGEIVPAEEYFASRRTKWVEPIQPNQKELAAYEKAVADREAAMSAFEKQKAEYGDQLFKYSPTKNVKPGREELSEFLKQNKIILSKEEKKRLLNSANLGEKAFLTSLAKMAVNERRLNVESLDELADMVKSGRIDKSVQDSIFGKLGVTTLSQAKKKLETMDNAIQRLQQKDMLRLHKELADDAAREIDNPVHQGGFDPDIVGEVPHQVPEPKVPVQEVIQTSDKTPSYSQSEAAVDRATTPDIAAALDAETKNRVWLAAKKAVDYEWGNWKKKYPHKTTRGAGRTDPTPGVGNAHWYGEFNAKKQYTYFKYALQHVLDAARKAEVSLNGPAGAAIKYDKVMPMLKAHDDLLKQYGIHPSLVPGGGYPLSLYDVLSTFPRKWVEQHFFNTGRQVTVDQLLHIAQAAVDTRLVAKGMTEWGDELQNVATDLSGFAEVVRGILGSRWSDKNVGGKASDFAKQVGTKAKESELKKTAKAHEFDVDNPPANYLSDAIISGQAVENRTFGQSLAPIVNEDFIRTIQEKVAYNSARANIQYGKFVSKASQEQVNKFIEAVSAAKTNDEVFNVVDGARKSVDSQLADTATIVPTRAAADEVKDAVGLASAQASTEIAGKMKLANRTATTTLKAAKAEQEVSRAFDDFVENIVTTPTYDLGERAAMSTMARLVHSVAPHIAEGDLRKIMLNNNVTAGHITAQYSRQLSQFQRRVGTEKAAQLFKDIQLGRPSAATDAAEFDEMRKIVSRIFDDGDPEGWSLAGNGIDPAHLNSNLKHFQVHESFKLPTGVPREESYGAWRNFEPNDPLDLLSRYHAAVQKTIAEKNLGSQISNYFGSARYQPGLAKVKAIRGSRIAHLINTDLYYPKDIIQNMFALDRTLKELAAPSNTNKLLRLYDSATHAYKAGLTIYRPGHHMRNLYGDIWLGAMDGVWHPSYYKRAQRIMSTRANHYTEYNFNQTLSDLSGNGGTALTLNVGGNSVKLSNDDVYRLAAKHGLLPNYSTIEDLGVGTRTNEVGDSLKAISPFKGRAHEVATDVSEYRDHWVRLAHFLKVMEDGRNIRGSFRGRNAQLNAIDELASRASNRVQKWHPNGSDNTKFERNVLRRGILFYSWIRKAIPLVLETAVLHPGRFLAFPKAMYTLAESNGIDLNGFTDPFPTDQLFPSWLGGNQGPQFGSASQGYIGMRMGVPMMDILDQYFTSPGHTFETIMGATNPAFKVPYELATGSTTQGIPINDTPKYLLGQVPFGNFVNTMLDKPIGGVSPSDEGYDPGGIRDPKAMATINLLTGLGLMDMSKPSYIKSGEFDVKYGRQGG